MSGSVQEKAEKELKVHRSFLRRTLASYPPKFGNPRRGTSRNDFGNSAKAYAGLPHFIYYKGGGDEGSSTFL